MRTRSSVLTQEERDILLLVVSSQDDHHLSNEEIARRLGLTVNRVKTLMHGACVKLGAHNRQEAILIALRRGEIGVDELRSLEELAEDFSSLGPDGLRKIAQLLREEQEDGYLPDLEQRIIPTLPRPDGILTNRERDVIIHAGRGLTNKEIAAELCVSTHTVRTFLNRASTKLGARKRSDAITFALKQQEISILDISPLNELLHGLARLGPEAIEQMARYLEQKPGEGPG